jgi:hypothetical protein
VHLPPALEGAATHRVRRRKAPLLIACAIGAVILALTVATFAWFQFSPWAAIRAIPSSAVQTADLDESDRFLPFHYIQLHAQPAVVGELQAVSGEWTVVNAAVALDDAQPAYPGWFNPAYAAKAAVCAQSGDGSMLVWAFNDGEVFIRKRFVPMRTPSPRR